MICSALVGDDGGFGPSRLAGSYQPMTFGGKPMGSAVAGRAGFQAGDVLDLGMLGNWVGNS